MHVQIHEPSPLSLTPCLTSLTKVTGTAILSCRAVSLFCVCVHMPALVLLHQNTLNRARITDASVQQVCKPLRQVCLHNTAVTAKLSTHRNSWCVEMFWVTSMGGGGEGWKGWHNAQRTTAPFLLTGINQCLVSQHSNRFPPSYDCLF